MAYKKQKKLYDRPYILNEEKVLWDILQSEKFGYSWCEDLGGVHHSAIVFYLDYEARYTLNWTPKNGTKLGSILSEIEGQLVFEDESFKDQDKIDYKEGLEEFDILPVLHAEDDKPLNDLLDKIDKLCRFEFEKYENKNDKGGARYYDIASCNCRDHVEAALRGVLTDDEQLGFVLGEIRALRNRPSERLLYTGANMLGKFFTALDDARKWISAGEGVGRFWEKMHSKAIMCYYA